MIALNRVSRHLEEQENRAFLGELAENHRRMQAFVEQWNQYANYVDPREPYMDDGEEWQAIGAGAGGTNRPATDWAGFSNEPELTNAREMCRRMLTYSEFVINGHNLRVNYAVDDGFKFKAVAKDAAKNNETLVDDLQAFLDEFMQVNRWMFRQRETVLRCDRDGEAFRRRFRLQGGMTKIRFVEPWQVSNPPGADQNRVQFGIECDPDDSESPLTYYVEQGPGKGHEPVDAAEIQHLKPTVDANVRRGIPLFWPARYNAFRSFSTLRNIAAKSELAAALAFTRSHKNTTGTAVQTFQTGNATSSFTSPTTGQTTYKKKYGPASIIDKSDNVEYEALNIAEGIEEMVLGSEAGLRAIAAAAGLPEYMLTSNAQNSNYASTMVAEGPAVRTFRAIQSVLKAADLEILDEAVEWAIEQGRLPAGILDSVEIQVELPQLATRDPAVEASANKTYLDARIISPQSLSAKLGLEYAQEQENIESHDKEHPAPQPTVDPLAAAKAGAVRGAAESVQTVEELVAIIEGDLKGRYGDKSTS